MVPIAAGVLLLAGIYVYEAYFAGPATSATLTQSDSSVALTQSLLVTLQNLHTIKLDNSIFSDPAYQSLTDFGVVIPAQTPGRRNPFAPLAGAAVPASGAGTVTIPLPKTK